jgi:hypothetical protein
MSARRIPALDALFRSTLRLSGACVAVVCIAMQLLGAAHGALVEHVRCAEHGELVHADGVESHAAPRVGSESAGEQVSGAGESHPHEHCSFFAEQRRPALVGPASTLVAAEALHATRLPVVAPANPGGKAVYELAPKTSPPAG